MPTYRVTVDERLDRVPGRDATAVTLQVERDDEYIGLFQTWISGLEWAEYNRTKPCTRKVFLRHVADELARQIQRQAETGTLRDAWAEEIVVLPINVAPVLGRASLPRTVDDIDVGQEILVFEA